MARLVTLEDVKTHPVVAAFIARANEQLQVIGYTEHGRRHVNLVARIARNVLERLGYPERERELAAIAGYVHDIGNVFGRVNHPQTGAAFVAQLLLGMGMAPEEVAVIAGAVGNHEEDSGQPVNRVGAALILADKTDVHRTRVTHTDPANFDSHDRVNYAAIRSFLNVNARERTITLELTIETEITPVMEYFEIFLSRMVMCRRAAEHLGCAFKLQINGVRFL